MSAPGGQEPDLLAAAPDPARFERCWPMKILVDRLTDSPSAFSFEGDAAWWRGAQPPGSRPPEEVREPLRLTCRAHRMGEDLYLEGSVEGAVELQCGRCLARYRHALRESFRLVLEPAGNRVPADPEAARALARDGLWLGDDLEAGWFRGSEIRLGALYLEVLSLALPVKPLCRDDCAGLCPHCGVELASASCSCGEVAPSSPFAALADMREKLVRGDG